MLRLEALGEEPLFKLRIFLVHAAIVVNFVNLAFGGFYAVIIAVMSLPPAFTSRATPPEAMVRPELQNLRYNISPSVQFERHGRFYITAGGNLYLAAKITLGHGIIMLTTAQDNVNILFAV